MRLVGPGQILALIQDMLPEGRGLAHGASENVNDAAEGFVFGPPRAFVGGLRAGEFDLVVVASLFLGAMISVHGREFGHDARDIDIPGREFGRIVSEGFEDVLDGTGELFWIRCKCHSFNLGSVGSTRRHTGRDPGGIIAQLFRACNSCQTSKTNSGVSLSKNPAPVKPANEFFA